MNSEEVQVRIENHGNTKHPDFMDYMVPVNSQVPIPKKLKIHMEQLALQLFVASFDPVQLSFFSSLFFLLKEPEALELLMKEIRDSFTSYDDITPDALASLPHLNACINETLRMHVATAANMPRRSPGAAVDGHYIDTGVSSTLISTLSPPLRPSRLSTRLASSPSRATCGTSTSL